MPMPYYGEDDQGENPVIASLLNFSSADGEDRDEDRQTGQEVDETGGESSFTPSAITSPGTAKASSQTQALRSSLPPRLQVPVSDRVGMYQQLRPYKGLTRGEKFSSMLQAAAQAGSEPGTGSVGRDVLKGVATGLGATRKIKDYEEAGKNAWVQGLLTQAAGQDKARQESVKVGAQAAKDLAEADKAKGYGQYLAGRGGYYTTRGETEKKKVEIADRLSYSPRVVNGHIITPGRDGTYTVTPPKEKSSPQVQEMTEAMGLLEKALGRKLTADESTTFIYRFTKTDDKEQKRDTLDKMAIAVASEKDLAKKAVLKAEFDEAAKMHQQAYPKPVKTGKSPKVDPIGDVIGANYDKYVMADGAVNWDQFKNDARTGKLSRGKDAGTGKGMDAPRKEQLVEAIEQLKRKSEPTGMANTDPFAGTNQANKPSGNVQAPVVTGQAFDDFFKANIPGPAPVTTRTPNFH